MKTLTIRIPRSARVCPVRFCVDPREVASRVALLARGTRIFLVTDRTVHALHGARLEALLRRRGADVRTVVVAPGERSKNRRVRDFLEDSLIRGGAERSSLVAALGGGVVGDLAGFASATIYRGLRLVQIPTTVIAQVDSAIGGKVGIDHPRGKNLLGAFHHPEAVFIAPVYLRTLPDREYLQGTAEILKYAAAMDSRLFRKLERSAAAVRKRTPGTLEPIIARCCALKASVVEADERESGYRRILNFGHTIGHALEAAAQFRLPHGMAVAVGMAVEAKISRSMGLIGDPELRDLLSLLSAYGLPSTIPAGIRRGSLLRAMSVDKKRSRGTVLFTLMDGIGAGRPGVPVSAAILHEALS